APAGARRGGFLVPRISEVPDPAPRSDLRKRRWPRYRIRQVGATCGNARFPSSLRGTAFRQVGGPTGRRTDRSESGRSLRRTGEDQREHQREHQGEDQRGGESKGRGSSPPPPPWRNPGWWLLKRGVFV